MNCSECHDFIDAYLDNELGVAEVILVEEHLRDCARCKQLLESRKFVGAMLDNPELRYETPDYLYGKIQSALPAASLSARDRAVRKPLISQFFVPLALAAALAVVLGLVFLYRGARLDRSHENTLAEDVVSSHIRSLLATHLLDVPSSDQHTVKPWFDGKLKFAPPVEDFSDHGFRLIGGRLDYLNGQDVAAVVYQRNKHFINLFIWPSESVRSISAQSFARNGYNVLHWARAGFEFWAVSDVNEKDLRAFADLEMKRG
jgi:anti-sigma factor RsiW